MIKDFTIKGLQRVLEPGVFFVGEYIGPDANLAPYHKMITVRRVVRQGVTEMESEYIGEDFEPKPEPIYLIWSFKKAMKTGSNYYTLYKKLGDGRYQPFFLIYILGKEPNFSLKFYYRENGSRAWHIERK